MFSVAVVGRADFVIRPMLARDVGPVLTLEADSPSAWDLKQLEDELAQPNGFQLVLLAEGSEKIMAYVCGRLMADEAEIIKLGVIRSYRRQGIGSRLLDAAFNYCSEKGVKNCFLELRARNKAARKLYEKKGFFAVGRRKNYYGTPLDDAVVMQRIIDNQFQQGKEEGL